jgi:lipoprotein-releasing system ATP-binding protein
MRTFCWGKSELHVLTAVNLEIFKGEMVALVGPSGSGKSSLLSLAGLLDRPDGGSINVCGYNVDENLNDRNRAAIRRVKVGFVYQYHHLLPEFTALENVVLPQRIAGVSSRKAKARSCELLERMGLSNRMERWPSQLSGGEQQRVAICRALANAPDLLLADEPTGNLDIETSNIVFSFLSDIIAADGLGALIATHNMSLAHKMNRILLLHAGKLESRET